MNHHIDNKKYWLKRVLFLISANILFREIKAHLSHKNKIQYPKLLPLISIEEIAPDVEPKTLNTEFEDGNVSKFELYCISRITKKNDPKTIFEIGTFNGRTTLNMAANANKETQIYTLDLPQAEMSRTKLRIKKGEKKFIIKQNSGCQFIGTEYEKNIHQIYSDSAKYDYKNVLNTIDLIFIDGSHSYEYVKNDTKIALQLLRNQKGIIIWHDYGWNEVVQALNEFYTGDKRFATLKNIKDTSCAYIKFEDEIMGIQNSEVRIQN